MSNPLYQQMKSQNPSNSFVQRFRQFQKTFSGDPQEQVQRLVSSGRISQSQYNTAYQTAQQMMKLLNGKL